MFERWAEARGSIGAPRVGFSIVALTILALAPLGYRNAWGLSGSSQSSAHSVVRPAGSSTAQLFKSPLEALKQYREDYRSGKMASSLEALTFAANGGQPLAQWKLGNMYRSGDGVPRDDAKAYRYFLRIIENYDEAKLDWRESAVISSAFVAIGEYSLTGVSEAKIASDPERAWQMFHYAATTFGNPVAQYQLARMYLHGVGVRRDPEQAARWLNLAADKGFKDAEALLGSLLFKGDGPVRPHRALGLMYLTLAREAAADSKKDQWIIALHDNALRSASEREKQSARRFLENYLRQRAGE